LAAEETGEAA